MNYIQGTSREQIVLYSECLDNVIKEDSPVRVIDAYVDNLDLKKLGFKIPKLETGKPPYNPHDLLKIYLYGYIERIRSSRKLEKECNRNQELRWLTKNLAPDFKTIADFRKNNKDGIKNIFKEFLFFCKKMNLLTLSIVGIDGTKLRAQNGQNNVFKRERIENIEQNIKSKIQEYLEELELNDISEANELNLKDGDEARDVLNKLKRLTKYNDKVKGIRELFENDPELQVYFANDTDSRFQSDKGKIRPGYNAQTAVDNTNKLIIANDVSQKSNDLEQMTPMIEKVQSIKEELKIENETNAVMDSGYFSEKEIMNNKDKSGINIIVPDTKSALDSNNKRECKSNPDKLPAKGYEIQDFVYDKERDIYVCPAGKELNRQNENPRQTSYGIYVNEYKCKECKDCFHRAKCTNSKTGRTIRVSINRETMDDFKKEMGNEENKKLIRKRKEIVEHPFGTIKRNLGFTYFIQKGIRSVQAEFSFICFAYNFKRVINILGIRAFIDAVNAK
ncbi:MAG: IS1182 family transposase [Leptospiraceae bacterium]|nr:IS1182 family transposase [Leptospiraceae bacterium]MCP5500191.1 IS1182 family transposase [Leptospiraceae bacterium]MCP5501060.1 IS1182 family transposase [Leptospiraceae bacterium]MCP5501125.1 IS1182 family transposase [Leptospiraceae bacterium]MCP5501346.1 IS1182 family transposase [Leptospiraceae bacterium]